jgi:hypothetical protein
MTNLFQLIQDVPATLWESFVELPIIQQAIQFIANTYEAYPVFTQVVMAGIVLGALKELNMICNRIAFYMRAKRGTFRNSLIPVKNRAEAIKMASIPTVLK